MDAQDRVLLVEVIDDGALTFNGVNPSPARYWVTPGGGIEPGEGARDALRREIREETGIEGVVVGPFLYEQRRDIELRGVPVTAVVHHYAVYTAGTVTSLDHLVPLERDVIVGHRWWRSQEIAAPGVEVIFPENIAMLVGEAIAAHAAYGDR